ncbi:MAG: tetratricopeptide repeat protein [Deltaproteobacteria bacterium]|nr:MAG: tetratricopeptide repeat protein [Deltaproteobacteria bacterium]
MSRPSVTLVLLLAASVFACRPTETTPPGEGGDAAGPAVRADDPVTEIQRLVEQGRLEEAQAAAEAAVAEAPEDPERHFALAVVLQRRGQAEASRAAFERTVALAPDLAPAQAGLGAVALELGDLDAAEQALSRAVAIDPEMVEAHYNLGLVRAARGDLAGARKALEAAADLAPDDVDVQAALASVLVDAGDLAGARRAAARALAAAPDDPYVLHAAAEVDLATGHVDAAIAKLERAAAADGATEVRLALAAALVRRGRREDLERAISLLEPLAATEAPDVLVTLGSARAKAGRLTEALAAFDAAIEAAPEAVGPRVRRVGVLADLGRCAEARAEARRISSLAPGSKGAAVADRAARKCRTGRRR